MPDFTEMSMQGGPCCSLETTSTAAYTNYLCCYCCEMQVLTPLAAVLLEPRPAGWAPSASSLAPWRCSSSSTQWQRTGVAVRHQLLQPTILCHSGCTHSYVQGPTDAKREHKLVLGSDFVAVFGLQLPFGTQSALPPELASTVLSTRWSWAVNQWWSVQALT